MRKMMEDVVLIGTAHTAVHLNGYSAGGKTGTAQKIDPRTHTYSKVNFVASFVGFAPVNNPAIAIAVITDSPEHSMHFGAEASAPVFQLLAQQILEYLGVPHDLPLKSPELLAKSQAPAPGEEDEPEPHVDNLDALFAEVNNLPADDPLRNPQPAQQQAPISKADLNADGSPAATTAALPPAETQQDKAVLQARLDEKKQEEEKEAAAPQPLPLPPPAPETKPAANGSVVLASGKRVAVPSFAGEPVRKVIEEAGNMGLAVQVLGTGIARDQAPAAGTRVPEGTSIVVRFGR
jgi:cell division protein FtsI (penicillin-binding protein 3)